MVTHLQNRSYTMAELDKSITQRLAECTYSQAIVNTPQERFDHAYITAIEIMDRIDLSRPTILAKLKNRFPVIKVGNTYFWERTGELESFLAAWEVMRKNGE